LITIGDVGVSTEQDPNGEVIISPRGDFARELIESAYGSWGSFADSTLEIVGMAKDYFEALMKFAQGIKATYFREYRHGIEQFLLNQWLNHDH